MLKTTFFCVFFLVSLGLHAHDSFFAFAELEYDEMNGQFEVTISVTSHDLEKYLQKKQIITTNLSQALKDTESLALISNELNSKFYVDLDPLGQNSTMDGVEFIRFVLDGYDEELSGTIRFYMHAPLNHTISGTFGITFNLLMEAFPEQQNKLTFHFREKKSTFVFLESNQKQLIDLH